MLQIYKTKGEGLQPQSSLDGKGLWVSLVAPTEDELLRVSNEKGLDLDYLRAALDDEERSRIESEGGQVLILINIPFINTEEVRLTYDTVPLGIVIDTETIVTVCLRPVSFLDELVERRPGSIHTAKRTRFLLQILYHTATSYLRYLKQIDRQTTEIEAELHKSMKNEELIKLLHLEKSLVYFTTSLRSNEIVMEKLLRSQLARVESDVAEATKVLNLYPEDEDLLEDVITENKQAIEMADIYSSILSGMMDAFASIISNNLNIVMKFLTSVTIVMALPTMVASFYGMNVALPLQRSPYAFAIVLGISILLSGVGIVFLAKRRMF